MTIPPLYTGQQFRIIRKEAKMSIKLLSDTTKVTRTQIYKFEVGGNQTINTYRKLIEALEQFKSQEATK